MLVTTIVDISVSTGIYPVVVASVITSIVVPVVEKTTSVVLVVNAVAVSIVCVV